MKEVIVYGETLPEAYHKSILALENEGKILSCNDWEQKQKEISMTFVVNNPLQEPMISMLYVGGPDDLQQYMMEITDGILDFEVGVNWKYTYHDRLVNYDGLNQIDYIINELTRNSDSRRAVAIVRDNRVDPHTPDAACLQHLQYFIRNNKLHCKVLFRSNDAVKAAFMNAFAFIMLQKKIADELSIEIGTYTHRANSYHCYERDFPLLQRYVSAINNKPITYKYEGYYKDMMDDSIEDILDKVKELKEKTE